MVDFLRTDGIACGTAVVEPRVQAMSILHNQDELLSVGESAMHRHVHAPFQCDDLGHARNVGGKNLAQVLVIAQLLYHLGGDNGDGGGNGPDEKMDNELDVLGAPPSGE